MRRAAKRDSSKPDIIDALRKCGWSVLQVSVKDGPDLFAAKRESWGQPLRFSSIRTVAIEVKTGKAKLKPGQQSFRETWQGEYVVCRSIADVLALNGGQG